MSFQFGSGNTPGGLFGATPNANTSINFKPPTFGAAASTGLSFGAPSAAPSFGAPSNSTFGPPTNQTFGASTNPTFGAPSSAPTFGAASTAQTFGGSSAAPTFGGAPTPQTYGTVTGNANSGLSFGAVAPTTSTGLSFGVSTAGGGPGLFGTPATSVPQSTLFAPTSASSLSFGTSTSAAPKLGLFGAPPTTTGVPAASGSLSFGGTTTPLATGNLSFSTSSAPTLGLNFNASSTNAPTLNFGASLSSAPTAATGLSLGLPGFNLSSKPTTAPANIGLGGVAATRPKPGITSSGKTELIPREQPLPNELQQTVQHFKDFVKKQKTYSSDVARCSIKEFRKVESEIDLVYNLLNEVEKQLQNNRSVAEKLKYDTAKVLQNVEIAQRTYDTPPGLQYDNTAPLNFFMELADSFERDMHALKLQIDNTDKYVKNLGKQSPLTSQDLTNGMRKLHETFVALAGRLQSVHSQVETQKEQYLNLRKYMLHDDTNIFEKPVLQNGGLNVVNVKYQPPNLAFGPTPFNSFMNTSVVQQIQAQNPPPAYPGSTPLGLNATTPAFGTQPQSGNASLFGNSSNFGQSSLQFNPASNSSAFQLQKPPVGNKRGKQ